MGDAPSRVVRAAGVREVYVADAVVAHYRGHTDQFDVARAESMLPNVLDDPLMVVQGRKAGTAVFVERFDDDHYLLVPVKRLAGELWIETVYIDRVARFHRRVWTTNRLYERRGPGGEALGRTGRPDISPPKG